MKSRALTIVLFAAFAAALAAPAPAAAPPSKAEQLRAAMRTLWDDHVVWTRLYIVSALADLPDRQATTDRLLRNQTDIGDAIKPYYGEEAGTKLTGLLREHILIAADIVTAAKAGDSAKLEPAKARWSSNADEIASFLSTANPKSWPAADMKSMMHEHLNLTTAELTARLQKDWSTDVASYEKVRTQILHMADMLADGIAGQFPEKVS